MTKKDYFLDKDIVPKYELSKALEGRNPKYSSELGKKVHNMGIMDARAFDHFMKKTFSHWGSKALQLGDMVFGEEEFKVPLDVKDVGVLSESPMYSSRSYTAIRNMSTEYGIDYRHDDLEVFDKLRDEYYETSALPFLEKNRKRDKIADEWVKEAKKLREKWEKIIDEEGDLYSIGGDDHTEEKTKEAADEEKEMIKKKYDFDFGDDLKTAESEFEKMEKKKEKEWDLFE